MIKNYFFFDISLLNNKHLLYTIYSSVFWLITSFLLKFYEVYRYTSAFNIISLLIKQFLLFTVIVFAFIGIFRSINLNAFLTFKYLLILFFAIAFLKLLSFYILKAYRKYLNGNVRHVIIIGDNNRAKELKKLFLDRKQLGYSIKATFSNSRIDNPTGTIEDSFKFLERNHYIDEIYCAIDELTESEVNQYVKYANIHHCNIKFIPNSKNLVPKRLKTDYYGYLPIQSILEVALNKELNKILKRSFDVIFSLFVIVFILSWVSIILFILVKLESKGPLFL